MGLRGIWTRAIRRGPEAQWPGRSCCRPGRRRRAEPQARGSGASSGPRGAAVRAAACMAPGSRAGPCDQPGPVVLLPQLCCPCRRRYFFNKEGDFNNLTAAAYHKKTHLLVTGFASGIFHLHELPEFNLIHSLRWAPLLWPLWFAALTSLTGRWQSGQKPCCARPCHWPWSAGWPQGRPPETPGLIFVLARWRGSRGDSGDAAPVPSSDTQSPTRALAPCVGLCLLFHFIFLNFIIFILCF